MKKTSSILIAVVISLFVGLTALAQTTPGTHTPHINKRQHEQQKRIRQGVRSGELTKGETKNIEKDERGIRQEERAARADGTVTPEERKDINKDLNKTNRRIYRAKHNNRDRN